MHYVNTTHIGPVALGSYPVEQRLAVFRTTASEGDTYFDSNTGVKWQKKENGRLEPITTSHTMTLGIPGGITTSSTNSVDPDQGSHKLVDGTDIFPATIANGEERTAETTSHPATLEGAPMLRDMIDSAIEICAKGLEALDTEDAHAHADVIRTIAASHPQLGRSWRCFHCDQVFTDEASARAHFGVSQMDIPYCEMKAEDVREMESELERYRAEDTALHRQIHAMQADHYTALKREEEKGYARGLRDARLEGIEPIARETGAQITRAILAMCKAVVAESALRDVVVTTGLEGSGDLTPKAADWVLTIDEWMVLEWLSKEDSSPLGECQGPPLDKLIEYGYAQHSNGRVYVTETGWQKLKREQQHPHNAYMQGYEDCIKALRFQGRHDAAEALAKRVLRVKERAEQLYGRPAC